MLCFHSIFSPSSRPPERQPGNFRRLRWKLLIAASLLAAVASAGTFYAAWHFLFTPWRGVEAPLWTFALSLLAPLAAIVFAAVFVYRHTARRRPLQAAVTALLASLLALAALALLPVITGRDAPALTTPISNRNA